MDGNVFLVNETKEASSHLERSQAFRRMMMKERLSYLTSREGMEINLSKLRDQLRSNSGHSMMIFGKAVFSPELTSVWGSMRNYHLVQQLPVLQNDTLLGSLLLGRWGDSKDSVCLKHFCEGPFDDDNQSHLLATLRNVSAVFKIIYGDHWKGFMNHVIDRVVVALSEGRTDICFMSWSINEACQEIFVRLRAPYVQPNADLPTDRRGQTYGGTYSLEDGPLRSIYFTCLLYTSPSPRDS